MWGNGGDVLIGYDTQYGITGMISGWMDVIVGWWPATSGGTCCGHNTIAPMAHNWIKWVKCKCALDCDDYSGKWQQQSRSVDVF